MAKLIFVLVMLHLLAGFGYFIYKINWGSHEKSNFNQDQ